MRALYITFAILSICLAACGHRKMSQKELLKKKYANTDIKDVIKAQELFDSSANPKDISVLSPLQYVNTFVFLDTCDFLFDSISLDINIKTIMPAGYGIYIVPLCGKINKMEYYCGIISGNIAIYTR